MVRRKKKTTMVTGQSIEDLEFHRQAVALAAEGRTALTSGVFKGAKETLSTACDCRNKSGNCVHVRHLTRLYKELCLSLNGETPDSAFRASTWFKVIAALGEDRGIAAESVQLLVNGAALASGALEPPPGVIEVMDGEGEQLASYLGNQPDRKRLYQRLVQTPGPKVDNRGDVLAELSRLTANQNERMLRMVGHRTYRQVLEESFWFRLAYHCFREHCGREATFAPAINEATGQVSMTVSVAGEAPFLQLWVPPTAVHTALQAVQGERLALCSEVLRQLIRLSSDPETGDLELERVIRVPITDPELDGDETEYQLVSCAEIERFWYSTMAFIPQLGKFAELTPPGRIAATLGTSHRRLIERSSVPQFLERYSSDIAADADGQWGAGVGAGNDAGKGAGIVVKLKIRGVVIRPQRLIVKDGGGDPGRFGHCSSPAIR